MSNFGKRKTKSICPRCQGTGYSRAFNRNPKYSEKIKDRAEKLFLVGHTLREIADELDLKHPQTVKNILSYR